MPSGVLPMSPGAKDNPHIHHRIMQVVFYQWFVIWISCFEALSHATLSRVDNSFQWHATNILNLTNYYLRSYKHSLLHCPTAKLSVSADSFRLIPKPVPELSMRNHLGTLRFTQFFQTSGTGDNVPLL